MKTSTNNGGEAHPPLPIPDEQSAGFWDAAAKHVFALARCNQCGHFSHPPSVVCAHCLHPDTQFDFVPVEGAGHIKSWIIIRDSFVPGFEVPFMLVDVELDVAPHIRMVARLTNGPDTQIRLGDRVHVTFDTISTGVSVPSFTLGEKA